MADPLRRLRRRRAAGQGSLADGLMGSVAAADVADDSDANARADVAGRADVAADDSGAADRAEVAGRADFPASADGGPTEVADRADGAAKPPAAGGGSGGNGHPDGGGRGPGSAPGNAGNGHGLGNGRPVTNGQSASSWAVGAAPMTAPAPSRFRLSLPMRRGGEPDLSNAVLIVSSRHRLWQRYGADGVFAIEHAIGDLVSAMAERGLSGTLVYVDDSPLLGHLGVLPAEVRRPDSVARTVRGVAGRMQWLEEDARYVLILGDDGIVPFHRVDNPSPDGEGPLLCDHDYGTEPESGLRPARSVGRIPDAGLGRFLEAIRAAAQAHRRLAAGIEPAVETGAFGYSASVWKRAARSVFRTVGDPRRVRLSPPIAEGELPAASLDGHRFRYYNLHGLCDSPYWFGQRDPAFPADYPFFPVALRPQDLAPAPDSVVFSEACYGASVRDRSLAGSLAHASLARGALAFVGATGVAYGGLDVPLIGADMLARAFWEETLRGAPAGDALASAKWRVVADALSRQGYLDAEDEKTVRNFVLYGDPSLVHHPSIDRAGGRGNGARGSGAADGAGPADPVGIVPARPHAFDVLDHGARTTADLTEHVRKIVARRLPEFASADVTVAADPSPRGSAAKSVGCASRTLVVTMCRSLPTGEGFCYRQYVRVTVDGAGRVRKLTLTR